VGLEQQILGFSIPNYFNLFGGGLQLHKIRRQGVDVMITIFAIFTNFRQKIGVFPTNQCYHPIFAEFSRVLGQKRQFFRRFLGAKIFPKS
jgi:hypothetical protein